MLTSLTLPDKTLAVVTETSPGAATNRKQEVTQYALPLRWGCLAIIAHNYLEGGRFGSLKLGDTVSVVDDGVEKQFTVIEIKRYQALTANSPTSNFIDQDSKQTISYAEVFRRHYETPGRLTLQTCISQGASSSWGRLFVVCEPKKEIPMGYTPGADYSYWQGKNDFDKAQAGGLRFGILRAGFNTATDPRYVENVQNSKDKLIRGAYWFYDWRTSGATPEKQGAAFKAMLASAPVELPPAMDFENPYTGWSTTPFPDRLVALQIMQRFKAAVGAKRMLLYINSSTLKTLRPFPDWLLTEWDLWIAAWPLNKSPMYYTDLPANWQPDTYGWQWTFWQYTAKMDGKRFGAGSLDLDGDVFNGDEDALRVYANIATTPPTPNPDPCPDISEQKKRILSIADELRGIADTL